MRPLHLRLQFPSRFSLGFGMEWLPRLQCKEDKLLRSGTCFCVYAAFAVARVLLR